ncbi:gp227 [Sphingomonas phage PAU]|uniref:gp227 n=1 Tax=Sphingomonas phage PAU TaxID=1150991 RepID=UPI0002573381|nr:gp227 [Sphingomonas phage PAU]AFF28225.1 gp227 [Sphingomonas phage PAU]
MSTIINTKELRTRIESNQTKYQDVRYIHNLLESKVLEEENLRYLLQLPLSNLRSESTEHLNFVSETLNNLGYHVKTDSNHIYVKYADRVMDSIFKSKSLYFLYSISADRLSIKYNNVQKAKELYHRLMKVMEIELFFNGSQYDQILDNDLVLKELIVLLQINGFRTEKTVISDKKANLKISLI